MCIRDRDECKPAAELCPGLPERVNEALKKAMAVEAGFRFGNVTDFRCALYGEMPGPDPGPQMCIRDSPCRCFPPNTWR